MNLRRALKDEKVPAETVYSCYVKSLGSIDGCLLVELPALVLVFTHQTRLNAI